MSKPIGELTADPEPSPYRDILFKQHDRLEIYPPYPRHVDRDKGREVYLFDDYTNIEIEASIYGKLVDKYRGLDPDQQHELAYKMQSTMGKLATALYAGSQEAMPLQDPVALVNSVPVLFEPINHAMLVGRWEDRERQKLFFRSEFIESREQQRLLLGGFAALVTYLEQQ